MLPRPVQTCFLAVAVGCALALPAAPAAAAPLVAYDDALEGSFADWSWATHDLAATSPVHGGARAISFEPDAWEAGLERALAPGTTYFVVAGSNACGEGPLR